MKTKRVHENENKILPVFKIKDMWTFQDKFKYFVFGLFNTLTLKMMYTN